MIRLYDTAKREKTDLTHREPGKVGIYVCGPTVYDMCHVGHARVYVAFDVVVRHMRRRGLDVTYVRNVTDVDDKIIKRAGERGEEAVELSARFTDEFRADMTSLGNREPDHEPKVSEHIPDIVRLIEAIIENGHAYEAAGDVYFAVDSFDGYGGLSRRNLDELRAGARVEVDQQKKRGPLDFALWKAAKPGEPSWDSPWGAGRPGWHIECSAMSSRYLGESFDIHGGGMDLIFPHHENEIAQSRAVTGPDTYAMHWMHNGFINVRATESDEDEKMSKSLGNFFTIREVLARHEPEALRLFLLGTHYRKPLSFEVDRTGAQVRFASLEDAEQRLQYAYGTLARLREALSVGKEYGPGPVLPPADGFMERFDAALDDDFNTAAAVGHTSELLTLANKLLDQPKSAPKDQRRRTLRAILESMEQVGESLGVFAQDPALFLERHRARLCEARGIVPADVERAIEQRNEARKAKDFERADGVRKELADKGVELMDGPGGTTWRVVEE